MNRQARMGCGAGWRALMIGAALVGCLAVAGGWAQEVTRSTSSITDELALQPVPEVDLSLLEDIVRDLLVAGRSNLEALSRRPGISRKELAEGYADLGQLYHAHHLYAPAEVCYRNAQVATPQDHRWPYLLGELYEKSGAPEQAAQSLERALELDPEYPQARLRLARVLLSLNQPERARALLEELRSAEEFEAVVAFELGNLAYSERAFAEAVDWYAQALAAQPNASETHYKLAMAYRSLGDIDRAREHLAQRGEVEPSFPDPLIDEMRKLSAGTRTHLYWGTEALWAKDYPTAVAEFRKVVALEPDNPEHRAILARALYLLGDREGSRRELEAALELAPENAPANYYLGRLVDEDGAVKEAMAHYRAALKVDPKHGGAHYLLGNALMREHEYSAAAEHYARAVELIPDDPMPRLFQSLALIATGSRDQEARARLEEALVRYPDQLMLNQTLARLLATSTDPQVRDGKKSLELAEALFEQRNSIDHAEVVAMAYAELGRFPDAATWQQAAIDSALNYGRFELLPGLSVNLELYEKQQACRVPWPRDSLVFYPVELPRGVGASR
jgi:tetratricopeptide (TPR) repeat protein